MQKEPAMDTKEEKKQDGERTSETADNMENITEHGSVVTENSKSGERIHCLSIIGQIEGHYLLGETQKALSSQRDTST